MSDDPPLTPVGAIVTLPYVAALTWVLPIEWPTGVAWYSATLAVLLLADDRHP